MATVTCHINATPAAVFRVLSDGWYFSNWVVGSSHVRAVEAGWPAPGSRLHHAVGAWPLVIRDETQVESVEPLQQLVLIARGRPLGEARVTLRVAADGEGSSIVMSESPVAGPGRWLNNVFTEKLIHRRNIESLARLSAIAERRTEPAEER